MKINRLASALTLSLLTSTAVNAAKYTVQELPLAEEGLNAFSTAINNDGDVLSTVKSPFNPALDLTLIDFDAESVASTLTDVDSARVGNFNEEDYATLYSFIKLNEGSQFFQQLAEVRSFLNDNGEATALKAFDFIDPDLGQLSQSVDIIGKSNNDFDAVVGVSTAAYYKFDYSNISGDDFTFVVHDFGKRGFVELNGQTVGLEPIDTTLGGVSDALDINNSFEVVGYGSTEVLESFQTVVDNCNDPDTRGDIPVESCVTTQLDFGIEGNFQRRAMIWRLDSDGNLLETKQLGLLLTPESDDERVYSSRAQAINDNGIAVGTSNDYFRDSTTDVRDFAAIFDGEEVIGFTDHQEYLSSTATDINNNDMVVGYAVITINGFNRTKFFVHDYQADVTTYPDDFFRSSTSIARAVNDNNLVVGDGEVDSNLIGARRSEAFIYDINSSEFTNLNDMLGCDSPYTIVQANDINNNDEIAATAVVRREQRDIRGELRLDDSGNPIFDDSIVSVKLSPIAGGSIDECQLVEEKLERKGGTFYFLPIILLFAGFLRRKN